MGQSYNIMNFDKREYILCSKLTEWAYVDTDNVKILLAKLAGEWKNDRVLVVGDYFDDTPETGNTEDMMAFAHELKKEFDIAGRIFVTRGADGKSFEYPVTLYDLIDAYDTKESVIRPDGYKPREWKNVDMKPDEAEKLKVPRYIVNSTTKQYVDREKLPLTEVYFSGSSKKPVTTMYRFDPVPILLACGNGLGGGDYHGLNMELAGAWAKTSASVYTIYTKDEIPADFTELRPDFTEFHDSDTEDDKYFAIPYDQTETYIEAEKARYIADQAQHESVALGGTRVYVKNLYKELSEYLKTKDISESDDEELLCDYADEWIGKYLPDVTLTKDPRQGKHTYVFQYDMPQYTFGGKMLKAQKEILYAVARFRKGRFAYLDFNHRGGKCEYILDMRCQGVTDPHDCTTIGEVIRQVIKNCGYDPTDVANKEIEAISRGLVHCGVKSMKDAEKKMKKLQEEMNLLNAFEESADNMLHKFDGMTEDELYDAVKGGKKAVSLIKK